MSYKDVTEAREQTDRYTAALSKLSHTTQTSDMVATVAARAVASELRALGLTVEWAARLLSQRGGRL